MARAALLCSFFRSFAVALLMLLDLAVLAFLARAAPPCAWTDALVDSLHAGLCSSASPCSSAPRTAVLFSAWRFPPRLRGLGLLRRAVRRCWRVPGARHRFACGVFSRCSAPRGAVAMYHAAGSAAGGGAGDHSAMIMLAPASLAGVRRGGLLTQRLARHPLLLLPARVWLWPQPAERAVPAAAVGVCVRFLVAGLTLLARLAVSGPRQPPPQWLWLTLAARCCFRRLVSAVAVTADEAYFILWGRAPRSANLPPADCLLDAGAAAALSTALLRAYPSAGAPPRRATVRAAVPLA